MTVLRMPGDGRAIYIAGPYSQGVPDEIMANVIDAAEHLRGAGWTPFIPHTLTFLWAVRHQHPKEYWLDFDNAWLRRCDAILRLPGRSSGADAEVELAKSLGLPVYQNVAEAINALAVAA